MDLRLLFACFCGGVWNQYVKGKYHKECNWNSIRSSEIEVHLTQAPHLQLRNVFELGPSLSFPPYSLPLGPINRPSHFHTCHISYDSANFQEKKESAEAKHLVIFKNTLKTCGVTAKEYHFSLHRTLPSCQAYISLPKLVFPAHGPPCHAQPLGSAGIQHSFQPIISISPHFHNCKGEGAMRPRVFPKSTDVKAQIPSEFRTYWEGKGNTDIRHTITYIFYSFVVIRLLEMVYHTQKWQEIVWGQLRLDINQIFCL